MDLTARSSDEFRAFAPYFSDGSSATAFTLALSYLDALAEQPWRSTLDDETRRLIEAAEIEIRERVEVAIAHKVAESRVLGVVPTPDLTDYWVLLLSGPAMAAAAAVAREALRQRGETKREELRQNGETTRTALTGKLPETKAIERPDEAEG